VPDSAILSSAVNSVGFWMGNDVAVDLDVGTVGVGDGRKLASAMADFRGVADFFRVGVGERRADVVVGEGRVEVTVGEGRSGVGENGVGVMVGPMARVDGTGVVLPRVAKRHLPG